MKMWEMEEGGGTCVGNGVVLGNEIYTMYSTTTHMHVTTIAVQVTTIMICPK
jgi:hypothetical protein